MRHRHSNDDHGRRPGHGPSRDGDTRHDHADGRGRHRGERGGRRSGRLFDHGELRLVREALVALDIPPVDLRLYEVWNPLHAYNRVVDITATMARKPRRARSCRRSGASAPMPPI